MARPALAPAAGLLVVAGVALAVHFATWIASLSYTSVAASVLLVNTAPLFTLGLLARLPRRDARAPVVLRAMALALVGRRPHRGRRLDGRRRIAGRRSCSRWRARSRSSLYHVTGRGLREALPLRAYILGVWGTAAAALAVMRWPSAGRARSGYPPRTLPRLRWPSPWCPTLPATAS